MGLSISKCYKFWFKIDAYSSTLKRVNMKLLSSDKLTEFNRTGEIFHVGTMSAKSRDTSI